MADRSTTGMPLLSGPAPAPPRSSHVDISCRKCNKEFNIVFTRARKCNHCGYSYCSSCSDYQALMPRGGPSSGFDPVPVCAFCIENLTITAGGRTYLRNLSLARLKKYVNAYNISADGVLEKDDLIERIMAARPSSTFPRPDLDPSRQQRSSPGPRRSTPYPQAPPQPQPPPRTQPYPPPRPTPPPMATPWPQHTTSNDPPARTDDEISQMSISALKTVLLQNHVNARLLLEKRDLVERVHALLGDERHERAREAAIHAREEEEMARQHAMMEEQHRLDEQTRQGREQAHGDGNSYTSRDDATPSQPKIPPPQMMGTAADLERNGLCVVCQDEEANIAIVDCGHLAMCRHCSDLIMSSSRECPLCRTRIVTEARLLRIFKS
ncbi:hypothetical protein BC826DRAFT_1091102 [Russula brevipes]|nr:hypothetical protein BC826DRAFT_1091102 [Russula brevipes]